MAVNSVISGRYATALYALAAEKNVLESTAADLRSLRAMLAASPELTDLIYSPLPSRAEQGRAMAALAEKAHLSDLTRRFLGVLAKNRRLEALPGAIVAFEARLAAAKGEQTAEVTSAQPLKTAQLDALKARLESRLGGKVLLNLRVDPTILGGLIVRVGSRLIDNSVKGKLDRLELIMKGSV